MMAEKPKRPMSAYMLWLKSERGKIEADHPGLKEFEVAKKAGEIWRSMDDKTTWEEKAAISKKQYERDLERFNDNGGASPPKKALKRGVAKAKPVKEMMAEKPKRPMSAYMLWLNSERGKIEADHPGLKEFEVAKKAGEIWRSMDDKTTWEEKAAISKKQYERDLERFNDNGGASPPKKALKRGVAKAKPVKVSRSKVQKEASEDEHDDSE